MLNLFVLCFISMYENGTKCKNFIVLLCSSVCTVMDKNVPVSVACNAIHTMYALLCIS